MISTLNDLLIPDGARQRLAADCRVLVERELAGKSGLSATAVKLAYKAVTAVAPGYYQSIVEKMVPDMLAQLQPFWSDFRQCGGGEFGDYLAERGDEVSEAMLRVTDTMATNSEKPALVKAYAAIRGGAGRHIQAALPAVGALVERYTA